MRWEIWFLIVFSVLIVAGIAYGVLTHDEAGFRSDKRWSAMPLRVACEGYVPARSEDCSVVRSVIETINTRLGFQAYDTSRPIDGSNHDVAITIGVPAELGWMEPGGMYELRWIGDYYAVCDVRTANTGTREMLFLTLYHELGCHCLGLAHDGFKSSICRREQSPTPDMTHPPRITDHDRDILRELYAP